MSSPKYQLSLNMKDPDVYLNMKGGQKIFVVTEEGTFEVQVRPYLDIPGAHAILLFKKEETDDDTTKSE